MNSRQKAFESTCRRFSIFLNKHPEVTSTLPTFEDRHTKFDDTLVKITNCGNQQGMDLTGLRIQKGQMKKSTGIKVLDLSNRIETFAKITGDPVLMKKVHLAETAYLRSADRDFMGANDRVYSLAESNKEPLLKYGVTPALLTDVKTSMEAYRSEVEAPKLGITGRKELTGDLPELIDEETEVLENLGALYELIRYTHPSIYAEYLNARKIEYRSGSLMVNSAITDAKTGLALSNVKMVFMQDGVVVLEKTTGDAGGMHIKSMEAGTYTVTLSKVGYVTQTLSLDIDGEDLYTVTAAMVVG